MSETETDTMQSQEHGEGEGQSETSSQTTPMEPGTVETFFDPETIKHSPELLAAYKQMQGAFTKKTQAIANQRHKLDAYDAFERDPVGTIQQLARQYNLQILEGAKQEEKDWQPQTWDDVLSRAEVQAREKIMRELEPMLGEVRNLKKQSVEAQLDSKYPDWRVYEDDMRDLLKDHPTLARDIDKLYNLAVPRETIEAKAYKAAMAKLQGKNESAQVSGPSRTTKQPSKPTGKPSFDQAVEIARARLQEQGIRP